MSSNVTNADKSAADAAIDHEALRRLTSGQVYDIRNSVAEAIATAREEGRAEERAAQAARDAAKGTNGQ